MIKYIPNYKRSVEGRLKFIINENNGLYKSIRYTLLCSRYMGLLPISGLNYPNSEKVSFSLRTPYSVYYVASLFGQVLMFVTTCYWLIQYGVSLPSITNFLFYSASLVSSLILLYIARRWPKLIKTAEAIELKLPPFKRNVSSLCKFTNITILVAALVEHLLSIFYGLTVAYSCDSKNVSETFFRFNMPWIFDYTPYTLWKAILIEIFNIQSTFLWSYIDVLIMSISIYLTEHFILHKQLLKDAVEQKHFDCSVFRIHYLKIVRLVKLVNEHIGTYILTSFAINLYWICIQLFYSLNKTQTGHFITCQNKNPDTSLLLNGIEHTVYFVYSLSFLLLRTLLVLLLAARINFNAIDPLIVLYDIPSSKYNAEVERYIAQIKNIKVALSGLGFFYVTRRMILTLLGTIVTYELVLLQFNK